MVWGNGVSGAGHGGMHDIQDIAPTIQYLLGVPLAPDVDGHIMTSILEADLMENLDRYIVDAYDWGDWRSMATDTDRDSLEKKLRSLGYIQ